MMSPSDMVGPSPVTSNGTETTEIEDDIAAGEAIVIERPENTGSADSQTTVRLLQNTPL
jgi:hypothetical protein